MITFQADAILPRGDSDLKLVGKTDRLVNGPDFVETIRPLANDFESEIDLGKSAGLYSFYQGTRQENGRYRRLKDVHSASRMAQLLILTHGRFLLANLMFQVIDLLAKLGSLLRAKVTR